MKHLELTIEELAIKLAQESVDKNHALTIAQELQQENEQLKARIKELEQFKGEECINED